MSICNVLLESLLLLYRTKQNPTYKHLFVLCMYTYAYFGNTYIYAHINIGWECIFKQTECMEKQPKVVLLKNWAMRGQKQSLYI